MDQEEVYLQNEPQEEGKLRQKKFAEKAQFIKSIKLSEVVSLNNYVDVFDNFNSWRNGYILDICKNDEVKIRFDGWSQKYDEVHRMNSQKISLFRSHAEPYTGGNKIALRDFAFDRSVEQISKTIEKIQLISIEGFQNQDPKMICQFLRGDVYFLLDSILQEVSSLKQDEVKTAVDLIEAYLRFVIVWMGQITSDAMVEYVEGKAVHANMYYFDASVGYVSCFPEFFDLMNSIFYGGSSRTKKFYQANEIIFNRLNQTQGQWAASAKDKFSQLHPQVQNFVNYFGQQGGFEKFLNLLRFEYREGSEVKQRLPFNILKPAMQLIESLGRLLSPQFRDKYMEDVKQVVFERLQNLTVFDLKDPHMNAMFQVLKLLPQSFMHVQKIQQESEQLEVRLAITFIKSQFLEKKVRGVKELSDIIEKMNRSVQYKFNDDKNKYFNEVNLANFLVEERIFELLLNEAWHPEVFKRATNILKFLIEQTSIQTEQIEALWEATQKKHENDVKAVLDTIAELTKVMSVEALDSLFEKLIRVPIDQYDTQILIFLKDFTINALSSIQHPYNKNNKLFSKSVKQQQPLKYEFYGLQYLWDVIQDKSPLNMQIMSTAIMCFINCVRSTKTERDKYIQLCIDNLKKGVSVPQSLLVCQHTIESFASSTNWRGGDGAEEVLNKLIKESNLIELVVLDFERYVKTCAPPSQGDVSQQVLQGKITHQLNIQNRLDFMEYVNSQVSKKAELTQDLFKRLWCCLVTSPIHENDKFLLLELMIKQSQGNQKYMLIRENQFDDIFKSSFSDPLILQKITGPFFKNIEKFFMNINQKNQSINISKSLLKVSKYDNIIGIDFFWNVVQNCPSEEVVNQAIQTLVNVHLRTEKISQTDQRLQMWQNFLTRCREVLRQSNTELRAKGNVIRCLKGLLGKIEGKKYYVGNEAAKTMVKFTVQLGKDEKSIKTLQLPSNLTLLEMRKLMGKEFNIGQQDFQFYFQNYNVELSPESEEDYSIQSIEEARFRDKTDVVLQNLSQNSYPGYVCVTKLRSLPSNWDVAEALFELLQTANDTYFDDIWEVLTLLPQNKLIKQQIEQLKTDGSEESWNKILHFSCQRKLLYCLQIVDCIIREKSNDTKWPLEFLKNKGLYQIIQSYLKMGQNADFSIVFNLKCFAQTAKLITYFARAYKNNFLIGFDSYQAKFISNEVKVSVLTDIPKFSIQYLLKFFEKVQNKTYQDNSTIIDFINSIMELINLFIISNPSVSHIVKQDLQVLIQKGLIEFLDQGTRKTLQIQLLNIIKDQQTLQNHMLQYVSNTFNKQMVLQMKDQVAEYMSLIGGILSYITDRRTQIPFTYHIIQIIMECSQSDEYEGVLGAAFKLMNGAIIASDEASKIIQNDSNLSSILIEKCLFQLPEAVGGQLLLARCQQPEHRKEGYLLLLELLNSEQVTFKLMEILQKYVDAAYWRTNSYQNWNITQVNQQKSRTGFVGLKNLGCICYMNSMLQQLFTLPHFRDAILQVPLEPQPNSVLYQFQILLSALKSSQKQYYDPRAICNVLGPDGTPVNVMEQMDVDEFWSGFMDKLENELKPLRKDLIIKRNFGGLISNELICKGCPHQSSREELFLALPLQVKNKKYIIDSLQTMTEGEMLEGDNAYFCEKCEKKIPTLMRVCIKKLPNVLLCVLKRFEFNYETLTKNKLNDYCEFPMKLDMKPYTREYLEQREYAERAGGEEDAAPLDLPEYPPEYYEYNLRGVIIHMGTADSGHYYSLIQDQNQWFEFNDTIVRSFDINDLPSVAFGVDGSNNNQSSNGGMMKDRFRNAYMLFYERSVYFDDNGKALRNENEVNWFFNRVCNDNQQIQKEESSYNREILQDNLKFQVSKIMFDRNFFDFSQGLLKRAEQTNSLELSTYCLQYFLAVVIRSSERKDVLPRFLMTLKSIMKNNFQLSKRLIISILSKDILLEFLIHNSVQDMKYIVAGLLGTAISCIAQNFDSKANYPEFQKESPVAKLALMLLNQVWELRTDTKKCDQLYRVLSMICSSSRNAKLLLLRNKAIGRLLLFFIEEPPVGAGYVDLNELTQRYEPKEHILTLQKSLLDNETPVLAPQSISPWDIHYNNYTYLIQMIADLLYAISIGLSNNEIQQQVNQEHRLDDDEIALLEDQSVLSRMLQVSYTRKARKALATIVETMVKSSALSVDDFDPWDRTQRFVVSIYQHIKDCEEKELKAGLICLQYLANIKDAYEDQRCQLIAEVLILVLKDGLNFWIQTEIVLDYIFKSCSFNPKLLLSIENVFAQNRSVLKILENWIKESQNPYNNFAQQRWKVFKKRNCSISSSEITQNLKLFQDKATLRNEKLQQILKKQSAESFQYDSDLELSPHALNLNQKIDAITTTRTPQQLCYDFNGYATYQIVDTIDDMVELKLIIAEQQQTKGQLPPNKWLYFDDDSFAKSGTATKKYMNFVNFMKS